MIRHATAGETILIDAQAFALQLWARKPFQPDFSKIAARLTQRIGRVEFVGNEKDGDRSGFFICHEYKAEFKEGAVPVQILILPLDRFDVETYSASLLQSWEWTHAKVIAPELRAGYGVHDMLGRALPAIDRLNLISAVLEAMLVDGQVDAIHWLSSQQFIDPKAYLANLKSQDSNPYYGAINVRMYNIQIDDQRPSILMDTVGLAPFGLPDTQCHFNELELNAMANMLYGIAQYILENGDVIHDGHTVQGLRPENRWHCQHEVSLIGPEREVLDINPGPRYATGNR
jgi:hypothetical protein